MPTEHFIRTVLSELQRIDGYQGAYLLRRDDDTNVRLQVLTLWDSLEAISSFAGRWTLEGLDAPTARTQTSVRGAAGCRLATDAHASECCRRPAIPGGHEDA